MACLDSCLSDLLKEFRIKVCMLNRSNCFTIRTDLSHCQIEWPGSWSSLLLTSFTGSPRLWLPTLSSQAANGISTSLRAPLLFSLLFLQSHMACGHAPHFSDNFSSERTGPKHKKDVHPAQSHSPHSYCTWSGERSSHYWLASVSMEWFLTDIEFESNSQ